MALNGRQIGGNLAASLYKSPRTMTPWPLPEDGTNDWLFLFSYAPRIGDDIAFCAGRNPARKPSL